MVRSEADLEHVGRGDVLVTRVTGPALAGVLPRVAGAVAEPVLGVPAASRRIPEGAQVAVDGIAGVVRWTR